MTYQPPNKRNFSPRMMLHDIHALKVRSRKIERLKYSLPGIALIALVTLISWPHLKKWMHASKPTLVQAASIPVTNNTATRPEFKSTDNKNQPYTITADHGIETSVEEIHLINPKMVMHLKSGDQVTLTANSGKLNKATNKLHLEGKVTLTHSQGYAFQTAQAWIDCNQGSAHGDMPISGDGPTGVIEANGFRLTERGTKVSFIGRTQLLLTGMGKKG